MAYLQGLIRGLNLFFLLPFKLQKWYRRGSMQSWVSFFINCMVWALCSVNMGSINVETIICKIAKFKWWMKLKVSLIVCFCNCEFLLFSNVQHSPLYILYEVWIRSMKLWNSFTIVKLDYWTFCICWNFWLKVLL